MSSGSKGRSAGSSFPINILRKEKKMQQTYQPTSASALESEEHLRYELRHDSKQLCNDVMAYFREYGRENPEMVALWSLGIGFVLGWKLKPW